jgi:hypothetical protein
MQTYHAITPSPFLVAGAIQEFEPGCDPDFDNGYEELERQVAELRLQLANH